MERIRLLLVDDEKDFVETLAERLEMRDLGPEVALNGERALEIVHNEVPDVMVLDMKMPGINGMDVLRSVRKHYPDVQVIILTGHGSDRDEQEALRNGAYAYMHKPVDIENLVRTIHAAYDHGRQAAHA